MASWKLVEMDGVQNFKRGSRSTEKFREQSVAAGGTADSPAEPNEWAYGLGRMVFVGAGRGRSITHRSDSASTDPRCKSSGISSMREAAVRHRSDASPDSALDDPRSRSAVGVSSIRDDWHLSFGRGRSIKRLHQMIPDSKSSSTTSVPSANFKVHVNTSYAKCDCTICRGLGWGPGEIINENNIFF